MKRASWISIGALAAGALVVVGATAAQSSPGDKAANKRPALPATPPTAAQIGAAKTAFADVYRVLTSPRCMNCHPAGDRPLQTDSSIPHAMNISRASEEAGLPCTTCHSDRNSEDTIGLVGGPPGAPHWGLPPKDVPMRFQGHTPTSLCEQLKDPKHNGKRSLADLVHHVGHDALVLWGWKPGGNRTVPPISHKKFVDAVTVWAQGGGACPEPAKR